MGKELVLVTGGGRAGKSDFAQDLALSHGGDCGVLFVATAEVTDAEVEELLRGISGAPGQSVLLVPSGGAVRVLSYD